MVGGTRRTPYGARRNATHGSRLKAHGLDVWELGVGGWELMRSHLMRTIRRLLQVFAIVGTLPGAFEHPTLGYVDIYVMYQPLGN